MFKLHILYPYFQVPTVIRISLVEAFSIQSVTHFKARIMPRKRD